MGIKPLHYALLPDGRLLFASEIKSLLECQMLSREIDPRAVEDYFSYGYVPDPRSIFSAVHKLEPGYTLTVQMGQKELRPRQYWDVPFVSSGVNTESDAREGLIEKLREAVKIRLISEVPLGAFLSGGVDSSAIVAMMAGLSDKPVSTCSIAFGDPDFNEAHYAAEVAEQFGTDHLVEEVDPDDYALVDQLAGLYDEPYADSSAMPTYRVCELARKRVTVALSGDGGDENFAGYRRYRWHMYEERLRSLMPRGLRKPLFGALGSMYPKIDWAPRVFRAKSTFQALARDAVEGYFHNFSILPDALRRQLYSPEFHKQLAGYHGIEVFNRYLEKAPEHPLSMVQYLDMKTYLAGDILTKVDRASMAHSLEVRVPILDHEFVEWVSGLPPEMKYSAGEGKRIFKQALEPLLSREILYRRKMGFAVPLASWFRGPLRQRIRTALLGETLAGTGIFNVSFLETLLDQHQSGRRDHSAALWSLLMFEAFVRGSLHGRDAMAATG
jgi:asparagine synthase (glutamine-hydrolysing)